MCAYHLHFQSFSSEFLPVNWSCKNRFFFNFILLDFEWSNQFCCFDVVGAQTDVGRVRPYSQTKWRWNHTKKPPIIGPMPTTTTMRMKASKNFQTIRRLTQKTRWKSTEKARIPSKRNVFFSCDHPPRDVYQSTDFICPKWNGFKISKKHFNNVGNILKASELILYWPFKLEKYINHFPLIYIFWFSVISDWDLHARKCRNDKMSPDDWLLANKKEIRWVTVVCELMIKFPIPSYVE